MSVHLARASAILFLAACTRTADLRDEADGGTIATDPSLDAGVIPDLDAGLDSDAFAPCEERPVGQGCVGTNDFPCAFGTWINAVAANCQIVTGCNTNGWLSAEMDDSGCVRAIGMDNPNDAMVACLVAELASVQCPCPSVSAKYFFGLGNDGVCEEP